MPMLKRDLARLGLTVLMSSSASAASAQGYGYGYDVAGYDAYGYGYAEPVVRGGYVGAPFSRTPRPSDLVPTVWGYGTYGIPTMTGIRSAPAGIPTVYVIDGPSSGARRGDGRSSRADLRRDPGRMTGGGARVIQVSVPRR